MTDGPHILHRDNAPELLARLRDAPRIAVDTEFHTEKTWMPQLFLVQIGFEDGSAWVVDPLDVDTFQHVAEAISAVPTWIVHGGQQDLRVLTLALGRVPTRILDTQVGAALISTVYPAGLGRLMSAYLDVQLDKRATLSDWSRRPLAADQLRYAAEDVALLTRLWDRIAAELDATGRAELAEQACEEVARDALTEPTAEDLSRELGGSFTDPREAHVLGALAAWRERHACAENRPARSIIGDQALRQIARLQPRDLGGFDDLRRLPRAMIRVCGPAMLAVIAEALACPEASMPKLVQPDTEPAERAAALRLVMETAGTLHRFAPNLVLPTRLRDAIALAPDFEPRSLQGWRRSLAGTWIDATMTGSIAIHIEQGKVRSITA